MCHLILKNGAFFRFFFFTFRCWTISLRLSLYSLRGTCCRWLFLPSRAASLAPKKMVTATGGAEPSCIDKIKKPTWFRNHKKCQVSRICCKTFGSPIFHSKIFLVINYFRCPMCSSMHIWVSRSSDGSVHLKFPTQEKREKETIEQK